MYSTPASAVRVGRRGFTVLELLVGAAIFGIMVILLASIISQFNRAWQQGDAQKSARQNARVIFDTISRDLQGAVPALPGTLSNAVPFQVVTNFSLPGSDGLLWGTALPANRTRSDFVSVGYFVNSAHELYRSQTNAVEPSLTQLTATAGGTNFFGLLAENVIAFQAVPISRDGSTNTATFTTNLPVAVDLTLALADWRALKRNPTLTVTNLLNPPPGVQVYRTRVDLPAAP